MKLVSQGADDKLVHWHQTDHAGYQYLFHGKHILTEFHPYLFIFMRLGYQGNSSADQEDRRSNETQCQLRCQ